MNMEVHMTSINSHSLDFED